MDSVHQVRANSRKRKSGEFASPKSLKEKRVNDENVSKNSLPGGLQPPGWTTKSKPTPSKAVTGNKTPRSSKKLRAKMKNFSSTPQTFGFSSVDAIAESVFGDAKMKDEKFKQLLRRNKPKQRLFGYAKEYFDAETKRLATGIKNMNTDFDAYLQSSRENERKMLSFVQSLELKTDHAESLREEAEKRSQDYFDEITFLKSSVASLKTDIEKERAKASKLEESLQDVKAKEKKFSIELEAAEAEKERVINEFKVKEDKIIEEYKEKLENKESSVQTLTTKLEKSQQDIIEIEKKCNDQLLSISKLEEKDKNNQLELARAENKYDFLRQQTESLEEKLKSRDTHLDKALETFQENQKFSQDRIATLVEEKAKLEEKLANLGTASIDQQAQITELTRTNLDLETEIAKTEESSKEAMQKLEDDSRRIQLKLELMVKQLSTEFDSSRKDWTKIKQELTDETIKLSDKVADLEEAKSNLETELEAVKTTYAQGGKTSEQQLEQLYEANREKEMLKHKVTNLEKAQQELAEARELIFKYNLEARKLRNEIQDLKGTVRVVARVRPGKDGNENKDVDETEETLECGIDDKSLRLSVENVSSAGNTIRNHEFAFNHVFGPGSTQAQVFDEVSTFVQSALDGYNVCLFSYGQTGSGKTYTMTGDHYSATDKGIIPRSISHIMAYKATLEGQGWQFTLEATFLEIYNETVRDLLTDPAKDKGIKHEIRDSKSEIIVTGLRREAVSAIEDVHHLLVQAESNRSVAATDSNLHSSRSHSVFTLFISGEHPQRKTKIMGSLSMCDLAGSERISKSGVKGDRLKETQNINKSLSSLADVFQALNKKSQHVPYRNSKLTQLVRPCFAGEGKVLMIVNLSSDQEDAPESLCSLRFASHVNQTEVGRAKKNISQMQSKRSSSITSRGGESIRPRKRSK